MIIIKKNNESVISTFSLDENSLLKANFCVQVFDFRKVKFNLSVWDRESLDFTTKVKKSGGNFCTDSLNAGDILLYEAGVANRPSEKEIYAVVVEKSRSEITLALFDDRLSAFQFSYAGSEDDYLRQFKFKVSEDDPDVVGRLDEDSPLLIYRRTDDKYNLYDIEKEHFVLPKWYDAIFDTLGDSFCICVMDGEDINIVNLDGDETEVTGLSDLPVFLCQDDKWDDVNYYTAYRNRDGGKPILIKVDYYYAEVL